MSYCNKSIIECLREIGVDPIATSSTIRGDSYVAEKAIDYTTQEWFQNSYSSTQSEYWMIDFKRIVSLGSYSISTQADTCHWIRKWQALTSIDNINWKVIDTPPEAYPIGGNRIFKSPIRARYFKIESLNGDCGYQFAFRYIFFYGSISQKLPNLITCISKKKTRSIILIFILLNCS